MVVVVMVVVVVVVVMVVVVVVVVVVGCCTIPQFSVLVFFGEGCSPSLTIPHHPSSLSFLFSLLEVCKSTLLLVGRHPC